MIAIYKSLHRLASSSRLAATSSKPFVKSSSVRHAIANLSPSLRIHRLPAAAPRIVVTYLQQILKYSRAACRGIINYISWLRLHELLATAPRVALILTGDNVIASSPKVALDGLLLCAYVAPVLHLC